MFEPLPLLQRWLIALSRTGRALGAFESEIGRRVISASYFFYKHFLEDAHFLLVRDYRALFASGNILDVGAHVGYNSVLFSSALSPGYQVHAFEPDAENFKLLEFEIRWRSLQQYIQSVRVAVGAQSGTADLWLNRSSAADHRIVTPELAKRIGADAPRTTVPVVSLDEYCAQNAISSISFIKIDVQGFEPQVCRGMLSLLKNNPQITISLEFCPEALGAAGDDGKEMLASLKAQGFKCYVLDRRHGLTPSDGSTPKVGAKGYVDLVFSRASL